MLQLSHSNWRGLVKTTLSMWYVLQELEARIRLDASAARQEILQMCEGMKRITLPVTTNADVSQKSGVCQVQASHVLLCLMPSQHAQVVHQQQGVAKL